MKLLKTKLEGAFIIDLEKSEDERGFFSNVWNKKIFDSDKLGYKEFKVKVFEIDYKNFYELNN